MNIRIAMLLVLSPIVSGQTLEKTSTRPPNSRMTRDQATAILSAKTKEELIKIHIDRMFPPELEGLQLPASIGKKGKPTVAMFVSSTCPHCMKEMPYLQDLYSLASDRVLVIPVFSDQDAGRDRFLSRFEWGHPSVSLTVDDYRLLPIRGTPTTVLAGADGRIVASYVGELSEARMAEIKNIVSSGGKQ